MAFLLSISMVEAQNNYLFTDIKFLVNADKKRWHPLTVFDINMAKASENTSHLT